MLFRSPESISLFVIMVNTNMKMYLFSRQFKNNGIDSDTYSGITKVTKIAPYKLFILANNYNTKEIYGFEYIYPNCEDLSVKIISYETLSFTDLHLKYDMITIEQRTPGKLFHYTTTTQYFYNTNVGSFISGFSYDGPINNLEIRTQEPIFFTVDYKLRNSLHFFGYLILSKPCQMYILACDISCGDCYDISTNCITCNNKKGYYSYQTANNCIKFESNKG